jgi:hypothetical protein
LEGGDREGGMGEREGVRKGERQRGEGGEK